MRFTSLTPLLVIAGFALAGPGFAQQHPPAKEAAKPADAAKPAEPPKEKPTPKAFSREFSGVFNGARVTYTATAGETFIKNDKNEDSAAIFSTAYVKKDVTDPRTRPITFVFNGGPGSASIWLHMGVFGPKQVQVPSDATSAGAPPYNITDNPFSILDVTDLVFIDPVGTGYSKALGEAKDTDFFGVREDTQSIANFVQTWLTKHGRWNSPRYVAGESYGTMRAAQLVAELQSGFTGVFFNGIVLISTVLDFHSIDFNSPSDLPYIAFLPGYAAAAWHHGKVTPKPESLEKFLAEVRAFTQNEYSVALLKGSGISDAERDAVIKKMAAYTGLSETYIRRANLRVNAFRFMKELLRDKGMSVGRFDARYTGEDYDEAGETFDNDPSGYGVSGAFVTSAVDYLTRTLKVDLDRRYKILDSAPSQNWKWADPKSPATLNNYAPALGQAMRENKDLRILAANGYYDLATPFFGAELSLSSSGIARDRVTLTYYEAGHMMYTHRPSFEKLAADVRAFIRAGNR